MSGVSFVNLDVLTFGGTSDPTSNPFTPAAAGNQIIVFGADLSSDTSTFTCTGTGTFSLISPPGYYDDTQNINTLAAFINSSSSATANQTVTLTESGSNLGATVLEYTNVASVSSGSAVPRNTPGTRTGAILGTAVTVPSGSLLIAFCVNLGGGAGAITTTGTSRAASAFGGGTEFCVAEYAGSGAAITPAFTSADGGSDLFVIVQFVMSPPSSGGAALAGTPSDATAATGALATGIDAAGAASDTSTASGTLVNLTLAEWDVGTYQSPQLQRRVFSDDGAVKCLAGGNACMVYEILPVTLGSGTLTIEDQGGTVVFTATTAQMSQGLVISVGETGNGILTVTSFPTGGEYGISWQAAAD